MFGIENAGLAEFLFRFRADAAMRADRDRGTPPYPIPETPLGVLVRKEMYFAAANAPRWNR
ncbi:MAG TPA: hypothetical protein VF992_09475 [Thermoplasmata archaeon]